jgi:hypothetical protein
MSASIPIRCPNPDRRGARCQAWRSLGFSGWVALGRCEEARVVADPAVRLRRHGQPGVGHHRQEQQADARGGRRRADAAPPRPSRRCHRTLPGQNFTLGAASLPGAASKKGFSTKPRKGATMLPASDLGVVVPHRLVAGRQGERLQAGRRERAVVAVVAGIWHVAQGLDVIRDPRRGRWSKLPRIAAFRPGATVV